MKWNKIIVFIFISILVQVSYSAESIATITKVRGDVGLKGLNEPSYSQVSAGQSVFPGDIVNVGSTGFCMVIFLDDKSILKIRESTEFQFVESENTRTINIEFGKILTNVTKERTKDFRIETPVSVASVKGTEWWTVSDPMGFDRFYGLQGSVNVFNTVSGQTVVLGAGQMTMSTATGQILTSPVNPDEIPEDPEEGVEEEPEVEETEEVEEEVEEMEEIEEEAPQEEISPEDEVIEEIEEAGPEEEEILEEEAEVEPEGESPFNMGLGLGSVTIDGVLYNQLALRPEVTFGKLGVGLDVVLYLDPEGNIRKNEWDEATDFFDKILYVRWAEKGDPFYVRYGALENVTLGYGGLISGYSNMMEFPQVRRIGLNGGVTLGSIAIETFIANFKDFSRGGGLVGGRATWNPWSKLTVGGNIVMDINQYSGLKDFDDDGVPDLLDDFPENKAYSVDTDGDNVADQIDPDQDGDGYTDNSQRPDVINNDPDGVKLKPEPFNRKKVDPRRTFGFAADIGYPVLRTNIANIDLYAEGNFLTFTDNSGLGLVPFGVKVGLFKIVNVFFEYRMDQDYYIPKFFDQAYDLDRVAIVSSTDNPDSLIVQTKEERIFGVGAEPANRAGFYGGASVDILNLVSGTASYTDMRSDTDTLRSFLAALNLNTDNIPKISQAFAYYQRNNDSNPFDFGNPSSNTILGYRVAYEISQGVNLVWDYRQLYQDLNGDGSIDKDSDEVINITTIETQFSF